VNGLGKQCVPRPFNASVPITVEMRGVAASRRDCHDIRVRPNNPPRTEPMSWPSSFGVAVLTAIVGLFASGLLASLTASWYRIPGFEAQSAAYVASIAIFGMIGGFIIGFIASRVIGGGADPGFLKALGISNGVLLGLLVIIGGVARVLADIPPTIDGEQLMLAVEIRWPEA
jgi:hypothetical protein